jgi:hypothetical protein
VTQHIFIELMDKVTIHAEEKWSSKTREWHNIVVTDIGRQELGREKWWLYYSWSRLNDENCMLLASILK